MIKKKKKKTTEKLPSPHCCLIKLTQMHKIGKFFCTQTLTFKDVWEIIFIFPDTCTERHNRDENGCFITIVLRQYTTL